jgi:hypothetical protein
MHCSLGLSSLFTVTLIALLSAVAGRMLSNRCVRPVRVTRTQRCYIQRETVDTFYCAMSRCRCDALLMFYAGTLIYILACRLLRGKILIMMHCRLLRVHLR